MSTLTVMRARIADDLDRTDLSSQIDTAINRAIEYYEKERFWFNETTGTFSTVANQQAYSSSDAAFIANIAEIDAMRITIAASNIQYLDRVSYDWILDNDLGSHYSQPNCYAIYQQQIYLYPAPNSVWTVTVSYQKKYAALTLDADTNDFLTKARDLIESRARAWLYARIIKDMEEAQIAKGEEAEALEALRAKTTKFVSSCRLKATCF